MFNFIFRGLLIILLSSKLREEWRKIILVIYYTRSIFFILFFLIIVFALLGHQLFTGEFEHIYTSIDAMSVLITTSNFPDIMLKNLDHSKFSIVFFTGFLLITYFIILSLLKALYYSNYLEINKSIAKNFLYILKKEELLKEEKLTLKKFLNILAKKYSLSREEIERFNDVLNVNNSEYNSIQVSESTRFILENMEEKSIRRHKILRIIRSKYVEFLVNFINISLITLIVLGSKYNIITLLHLFMFLYFIIEYIPYMKHYSFKKLFFKKTIRSLFFILNVIGFSIHLITVLGEIFQWHFIDSEQFLALTRVFILLRSLRLFILLNMFPDFNNIFSTIHNMKNVFGSLLASLFSFFFIFSTFSIILFGGKIKYSEYEKINYIPNEYSHINFNDYGSSFLLCFCLVIYNNMNTLIDHLCKNYTIIIKPYFTFFYFMAILILVNIFQTFVLDMYLNVKKTKIKVIRKSLFYNNF